MVAPQAAQLRDGPVATASDPGTFMAQADVLTPAVEVRNRQVTFPNTGPAKWYQAVAGSGDKQAKANLCRLEIEEVTVAFEPPTSCKVITEAAHCPLLGFPPDCGPHRYSATDVPVVA
jgi:hypothetical protein